MWYKAVMFDTYLTRWNLVPDGDPIITDNARLLPVRDHGQLAMLKLAITAEVHVGGMLLEWWDGDGAALVLARADEAILMERAQGRATLTEMAYAGQDDEACRTLCALATRLHAPRARPMVELVPLAQWFPSTRACGRHLWRHPRPLRGNRSHLID
jgi:streptomycin 6-kinase